MDYLFKNPIKVIRLAPEINPAKGSVNTLLGGGLPVKIYNAIKHEHNDVVRQFFGNKWRESIGDVDEKKKIFNDVGDREIVGSFDIIGAAQPELSDLEKLLEEHEIKEEPEKIIKVTQSSIGYTPANKPLPKDDYVFDMSPIAIFPEDRLSELKEKIYVATGVPVQRQHIFWVDDSGMARTTYKMKTADGGDVHIDARNLIRKLDTKTDNIFGLEIDRYLYDNWENITVVAYDTFKTVEDVIMGISSIIYMIDLADVLYNQEMLVTLVNDKAKRDLLFYSVLFKYWPWFPTSEDLLNESNLFKIYPLLAPDLTTLKKRFEIESSILSNIPEESKYARDIVISISMAVVSVSTGARVDIRNLFDKLQTNFDMPHINAYIFDGSLKYNLNKHHIGTPFAMFPNQTRSGLTIAIPVNAEDLYSRSVSYQAIAESQTGSKKTYLFLNIQPDGVYYILSHFGDEEKMNFDKLIILLMRRVNPVINEINKYSNYIFMGNVRKLDNISYINARYPDINISLIWKKQINEGDFKSLKDIWNNYQEAGMLAIKPISFNSSQNIMLEMNLFKGCVEYNINQIARSSVLSKIKNYYSHLTNPTVHSVWENMYNGRTIRMIQRSTDVQFEIFNATQNNFIRFYRYLDGYIEYVLKNNILKNRVVKATKIKKLRALQEADPELYNLRKHGSTRLYTVVCQEPRQPVILSSKNELPKKATDVNYMEYVNITTKKPVYYYCDTANYPVISFITGVHPLGYCLPCCKKNLTIENSDKYKEDSSCKSTGFPDIKESNEKLTAKLLKHIIIFNKPLPKGRLGLIPRDITNFLESIDVKPVSNESEIAIAESCFIFGVEQEYPGAIASSGTGSLAALASIINISATQLANSFIKFIKTMGSGYESLLNGEIIEWFESIDSLIGTIHKIFVAKEIGAIFFNRWMDLFVELFRLLKNIEVVVFNCEPNNITIEYSGSNRDVTAILLRNGDMIYPLFYIDINEFGRTQSIKSKLFVASKITAPIYARYLAEENKLKTIEESDFIIKFFEDIKDEKQKDEKKKVATDEFQICVTTQRVAYGVIGPNVFITFKPTHTPNNFPIYTDVPKIGKEKNSLLLLEKIKKGIPESYIKHDKDLILFNKFDKPIAIAHISGAEYKTRLWKSILSPSNEFKLSETSYYKSAVTKHNEYNLLLMEFTTYADNHKNNKLRNDIKKAIEILNVNNADSLHEFSRILKRNIKNQNDIGLINSIISQNVNNKKRIIELFDNKKFNFDKNNYDDMAQMSDAELKVIIDEFVNKRIEKTSTLPPPPNNLTLPVGIFGKKLKIYEKDLGPMLELLSADLKNPLKLELMKSGALSSHLLLDLFKFEKYPNETIKIEQL